MNVAHVVKLCTLVDLMVLPILVGTGVIALFAYGTDFAKPPFRKEFWSRAFVAALVACICLPPLTAPLALWCNRSARLPHADWINGAMLGGWLLMAIVLAVGFAREHRRSPAATVRKEESDHA